MAGHSKWANIKRRKGAQDAARGKLFTKLIREITVAARMGGPDPEANPRLRLAIDRARAASMPKDNIQRAIAKGSGELTADHYEEFTMEGYANGGVAVLVEVLTDNRNRATSEIRHAFSRCGGNLGTSGCVAYLFHRKGVILVPAEGVDEDRIMEVALEAGAEDLSLEGDTWEVLTAPAEFEAVRDTLAAAGLEPASAELLQVPDVRTKVAGKEAGQLLRLLEMLDDLDDVQAVHHNAEISEEELAGLAG